jgi:hypothetical protein
MEKVERYFSDVLSAALPRNAMLQKAYEFYIV